MHLVLWLLFKQPADVVDDKQDWVEKNDHEIDDRQQYEKFHLSPPALNRDTFKTEPQTQPVSHPVTSCFGYDAILWFAEGNVNDTTTKFIKL